MWIIKSGGDNWVEPLTHLAVASKIQEHFEMRNGPDEVGDVIRLGGLERSAPSVPVTASSFVDFVGRLPLVALGSQDKRLCRIFPRSTM